MKFKITATRLLLLVACTLVFLNVVLAQTAEYSITGTIADSTSQKRLDFITVNLMKDKTTVLSADYSKEDGSFLFSKLTEGKYELVVVGVGYNNKIITVDLAKSVSKQFNVGRILLASATLGLKEVTVTALKPIIKQEADRISYDLQADPESKVFSVLDMMRKVPMLALDADNNLLLKGNSDFKILINGKPSSMVERNYKEVLRSMPASSIERIEVITSPPAKYDGEGLAGIINIITNKKVDNGYNGTLNISERFPIGGPGLGGSFSAKLGKIGMSAFGGASIYESPQTNSFTSRNTFGETSTSLQQNGLANSNNKTAYLGYEVSYEIDSLNLLSAQLNVNGSRFRGRNSQQSSLSGETDIIQKYNVSNSSLGKGPGMDAALNYQKGFKADKNRLLTFSYRVFKYSNNQSADVRITDRVAYDTPDYQQINDQKFSEQTYQIDYVHPVKKKLNIEAGIKAIFRNNNSDFKNLYFNDETDVYELQPAMSNQFRYGQNVYGAYNSYQYNLKKWSIKAGARIEQTVVDANFISNDTKLSTHYFNLIPSFSANRKLNDASGLNFNYAQRIQRPGIYQLNPFVDRTNPNFEKTGNPNLKPARIQSFNLGYNFSKKISLNLGLGFMFFRDLIFPVSVYDATTNITRTSYGNTGTAKLPQTNLSINYPITKQWSVSLNSQVAYGIVQGEVNGVIIKNEGLMYNNHLSMSYKMAQNWRIGGGLSTTGPSVSLQGTTNPYVSSNFSINKDIIQDKLSFSAAVNNPFTRLRRNDAESFGPDFEQLIRRRDYFRSFNFSLNYKFGKLKDAIRKNKRGIRNDDVQNGG